MNSEPQILGVFRSHFLKLLGKWIIVAIILIVILASGLLFLPDDARVTIGFAAIWLMLAMGMYLTSYTHWRLNTDTITRDRLTCVRLHGIFHYSVDAIPLRKVQSVDLRQEGLLQNIFGYANIYIASELYNETEKNIILHNISKPVEIVELLRSQSDAHFT